MAAESVKIVLNTGLKHSKQLFVCPTKNFRRVFQKTLAEICVADEIRKKALNSDARKALYAGPSKI